MCESLRSPTAFAAPALRVRITESKGFTPPPSRLQFTAKRAAFAAPVFVQRRQRGGDEPGVTGIASARQPDWRFVPKRQSRCFRPRDEARNS